jgi:hypothetical protein
VRARWKLCESAAEAIADRATTEPVHVMTSGNEYSVKMHNQESLLRIDVVGCGHSGAIHVRVFTQLKAMSLDA